jgi:hypothetical protein
MFSTALVPSQNARLRALLSAMGIVVCLWLMISAHKFRFGYMDNEVNSLPTARQAVEPNWLKNDWYLNLGLGYQGLFYSFFGPVVTQLGFQHAAYAGRLVIYLGLAVALRLFFKAIKLPFPLALLVLLVLLRHGSLVAGEWIFGGVEAKPISYFFAVLALTFFIRRAYLAAFAFAGAAISLHVLVGGYAAFCLAAALLLNQEWRSEWRRWSVRSWPLFLLGLPGLAGVLTTLLQGHTVDTTRAWELYVQYRNPHHLLPSGWVSTAWIPEFTFAVALFAGVFLLSKSPSVRFIAGYALGSTALFLIGLVLFALGRTTLLLYYWFRFPDVMVPFLGSVLVALLLAGILGWRPLEDGERPLPGQGLQTRVKTIVSLILILAAAATTGGTALRVAAAYGTRGQPRSDPRAIMLDYISENTPREAVFLVDPTIQDFYVVAQRAMFVSWKHVPESSPEDVLEWYRRITLANGRAPTSNGRNGLAELEANFYKLNAAQITEIASSYGVDYYLGKTEQQLPLERVYSHARFTLYRIDSRSTPQTQPWSRLAARFVE